MCVRSIEELWPKIKAFCREEALDFAMPALVFLVAIGSFGLGRLSALQTARPAVSVYAAPMYAAAAALPLGGEFVAARGGKTYYYPWCSGALKIKPENQVWFRDKQAARNAGYFPARNCKGLVEPLR